LHPNDRYRSVPLPIAFAALGDCNRVAERGDRFDQV